MLQLLILAAGAWRATPERALYEAYLSRLPWKVELQEIELKPKGDTEKDRAAEGEKMLAALAKFHPHHTLALDERGKNLSSKDFAGTLIRWQDAGENRLAICIGGHHGLDAEIRKKAELVLSFGQMTWPHLLARAMLAEQLYRAHSIMTGHPYHRE